jgi:hypothetical protein
MKNIDMKLLSTMFFGFFVFLEVVIFVIGEGTMVGYKVFDNTVRIYSVIMIVISIVSIVLIFKDKQAGYAILGFTILITMIVYFGHHLLLWPCEHCSF